MAFCFGLLVFVCCYCLLLLLLLHLLLEKLRARFCLLLLGCLTVVNPPSALVLSCETTRLTSSLLCASRDVYRPAACSPIIKFPEACTSAFSDCRKRRGPYTQVRRTMSLPQHAIGPVLLAAIGYLLPVAVADTTSGQQKWNHTSIHKSSERTTTMCLDGSRGLKLSSKL